MNRIDRCFQALQAHNKKALVTFITAGDPDLETTEQLVLALEKEGVDVVELGIPFSDPVAEGPVIQEASARALKNGVKTDDFFELVKRLRAKTDMPILFMMYVNCIYVYGKEKFFDRCLECGIDGVIVPDLPFEEKEEIEDAAESRGIHSVSLVAPTSRERVSAIASQSRGFLYCVSSLGVTGTRDHFDTNFAEFFGLINRYKASPACVGFGISTPEQVQNLKGYCDGVIVGSAIVRIIGQHGRNSVNPVSKFVKELKSAL